MCIIYVETSPDRTELQLRPVCTDPDVRVDAIWDLYPGQSFYGLTFEQLLDASKVEIKGGVARIVTAEGDAGPG